MLFFMMGNMIILSCGKRLKIKTANDVKLREGFDEFLDNLVIYYDEN